MHIRVRGIRFRLVQFTESDDGYQVNGKLRPPWGWRRRTDLDPISRVLIRGLIRGIGNPVDARIDAWWEGKYAVFSFIATVPQCCTEHSR